MLNAVRPANPCGTIVLHHATLISATPGGKRCLSAVGSVGWTSTPSSGSNTLLRPSSSSLCSTPAHAHACYHNQQQQQQQQQQHAGHSRQRRHIHTSGTFLALTQSDLFFFLSSSFLPSSSSFFSSINIPHTLMAIRLYCHLCLPSPISLGAFCPYLMPSANLYTTQPTYHPYVPPC